MGPLCRDVYYEFKKFGFQPIILEGLQDEEDIQEFKEAIIEKVNLDGEAQDLIQEVLARYGHVSALQLQMLTD